MGKINQQGSMNGRSNSFLDEVNFERAMKRFNPETGNTHYSFSMHSDSGLTLRKFILSENSENEISGHVFEYEVDADWLAEIEIFPGWHQYNGYFRILDLDGEVIAENEIISGSSVSKESSNGRSSGYICITTTRRIGWVGVHPDYMEARYETTTNCFTITNIGTPAPTGGGGSGLLQISQEVGFLTSSRDDFPLNTCSADNTKYENGTCVCINGYIKDENDNCVSRLPCVAGYVRDGSGGCVQQTELEKIMKCEELSDIQLTKLEGVLEEYLNSEYLTACLNIQIFEYVVDNNKKLCFKMGTNTGSMGEYHSSSGSIHFKNSDEIKEHVFGEEFFHAYQDILYQGLSSNLGRSNIEFEAKLFHDLSHNGQCCITFSNGAIQTEYINWIIEITDLYEHMPIWGDMSEKYFYFIEKFIEIKPEYNYPIDYSQKPEAIFNLNDCL